jgi:hypothetical protein
VALEGLRAPDFRRKEQARETIAIRRERLLVESFAVWLASEHGLTLAGLDIPYAPEARVLRADGYVADCCLLVEAKASSERGSIRLAIGQLLDYARYLEASPRLCVLTPSQPAGDMLDLVGSLNHHVPYEFGCAWQADDSFVVTPITLLSKAE